MKKILVTGGLLTYMLLVNSGVVATAAMLPDITASETVESPKGSIRHEKNFEKKISVLAAKLGLDADEVASDVASNLTLKEILKKHGITKSQLNKVMGNKRPHHRQAR